MQQSTVSHSNKSKTDYLGTKYDHVQIKKPVQTYGFLQHGNTSLNELKFNFFNPFRTVLPFSPSDLKLHLDGNRRDNSLFQKIRKHPGMRTDYIKWLRDAKVLKEELDLNYVKIPGKRSRGHGKSNNISTLAKEQKREKRETNEGHMKANETDYDETAVLGNKTEASGGNLTSIYQPETMEESINTNVTGQSKSKEQDERVNDGLENPGRNLSESGHLVPEDNQAETDSVSNHKGPEKVDDEHHLIEDSYVSFLEKLEGVWNDTQTTEAPLINNGEVTAESKSVKTEPEDFTPEVISESIEIPPVLVTNYEVRNEEDDEQSESDLTSGKKTKSKSGGFKTGSLEYIREHFFELCDESSEEKVRLPTNLKPRHYHVDLFPHIYGMEEEFYYDCKCYLQPF